MFQSREEAGDLLSKKLERFQNTNSLVCAVPRGGVVLGKIISSSLKLPLSLVIVRKIGAPNNPELAIGAMTEGVIKVLDQNLIKRLGVSKVYLKNAREIIRKEIGERVKLFSSKQKFRLRHCDNVILTDDGIATGATIEAAIKLIRQQAIGNRQQVRIILAVPVVAIDAYIRLKSMADEIIALEVPTTFRAVGEFYREFPQVSDSEVINILGNLSHL